MGRTQEYCTATAADGAFRTVGSMNTEQRLWEWVRAHVARVLGVPPESIDLEKGLSTHGLDSVDAVLMAGEIEDAFGIEIDPGRFLQYDSFQAIIAALAADIDQAERARVSS
jgi:acyl carrier protein